MSAAGESRAVRASRARVLGAAGARVVGDSIGESGGAQPRRREVGESGGESREGELNERVASAYGLASRDLTFLQRILRENPALKDLRRDD